MKKCNVDSRCQNAAEWTITAAYPIPSTEVHPRLGCYPAAMARACNPCLPDFLRGDMKGGGSTQGWYIKPVDDG